MKLYAVFAVLYDCEGYSLWELNGIFDSMEKAKEYAKDVYSPRDEPLIEEWELNKGYD